MKIRKIKTSRLVGIMSNYVYKMEIKRF